MAINVYFGGTTGLTDGTLEVPHDFDTRLDLGNIGSVATLHFRAADGYRNGVEFSVADIPYCEVSKDGVTYATSVTYAAREVVDTNVPLYIKRVSGSIAADITVPTSPRLPTITEIVENRAPAAFTPTITDVTTTSATVTFATTDPDSDTLTYKVAVTESATPPADWSGYSVQTSPYSATGLTENTTYYAHVQANDGALTTVGTSNSFITTATDVTAPTWGEGAAIASTVVSSAQIDLSWPAATDNVAVTGYDIEWGTTLSYGSSATSATASYSITGLTAETLYYIRVRPYDAANNKGEYLTDSDTTAAIPWFTVWGDSFNRADSTTVGNGWSQGISSTTGTTYGISGNALRVSYASSARDLGVWRASDASFDRAVEATMTATPSSLLLQVGRRDYTTITSLNSGYGYQVLVSVATATATIRRIDDTSSPALATSGTIAVTAGTTYRFEHNRNGNMTLFVNGVSVLTANDTTYMTDADVESYGVGAIISTSTVAGRTDGRIDNFYVDEQVVASAAFSDDFNRTDSTTVSNGWTQYNHIVPDGAYGIVSNALSIEQVAATGSIYSIYRAIGGQARGISVDVPTLGSTVRLVVGAQVLDSSAVWYSGLHNCYFAGFGPTGTNNVTIYKRTNSGSFVTLGTVSTAFASGDNAALEHAADGTMVAKVNGSTVLTVSDTALMYVGEPRNYSAGVVLEANASTTTLDNLSIYAV